MKTIIDNIQIAAVTSWLPLNNLEMTSLSSEYGEKEVASIIKATGVERVRIADKNDTYAALTEGTISNSQKIIVSSNKTIKEGDRVRLEEE